MSIAYIIIILAMVAVAGGFAILAGFGLRNLARGKHTLFSIGAIVVPFVIFGIISMLVDGISKAAILTVMVMAAIAIVALLFSGVRGMVG